MPPTTPCRQQPIPGSFAVMVRTTYPIPGWLQHVSHTLKSGAAQTQAIMRWSVYLQQRHVHSTPPLSQEWQTLLGPVTFVSEGDAGKTLKGEPIGPLPVGAGAVPGPPDAWCADTHAKGSPLSGMLRTGPSATDPCADYGGDSHVTGRQSLYVQGTMKQMHLLPSNG